VCVCVYMHSSLHPETTDNPGPLKLVDATAEAAVDFVAFAVVILFAMAAVSAEGVAWEKRGAPGSVEIHTRGIPVEATSVRRARNTRTTTPITLLDLVLVVLLVVSQVGSTSAYKCSWDWDCHYNGCNNIPCDEPPLAWYIPPDCKNGVWQTFCPVS